jgi:hypothetical protein
MKKLVFIVFIGILFSGCIESSQVTKEDCQKIGKSYQMKKVFNYRNGEYENRSECI